MQEIIRYNSLAQTNTMKKIFLIRIPTVILFAFLNITANTQPVENKAQTEELTSIAADTVSKKQSLINLLDFKTRKKNNSVSIEWMTESETGTKYFEIERSNDGNTFSKIGEKLSKNAKTKTSYTFLDEHPLLVNYYRLKVINLDGASHFSKVIAVNQNGAFHSTIQPNPFMQSFAVQTFLSFPQPIKIQLLDMSGKLIRYKSTMGVVGNNKVEFDDVGSLKPGIYMIRIVRSDNVVEKKIVKGNQ